MKAVSRTHRENDKNDKNYRYDTNLKYCNYIFLSERHTTE